MKIKISSDSTCDLPPEIVDKHNIGIVPLYITKDGKQFKDRLEINVNDIFDYVESGKGITHSAAVNMSEYTECFEEWLGEYDAVIHISLSSHISVCHQNALLAAEELENVYIVNSQNLSTGSGHIVLDAALMAEKGMQVQDIITELNELIPKVEASFVIGTLKYLKLGGRCSALAALGANLLKLNPCIAVTDGKMDVAKKYRGAFNSCIMQYVTDRLSNRDDIDTRRIFVTYPPTMEKDFIEQVVEKVKSLKDFDEIICSEAGCVISNHCGPICVGILFYRK